MATIIPAAILAAATADPTTPAVADYFVRLLQEHGIPAAASPVAYPPEVFEVFQQLNGPQPENTDARPETAFRRTRRRALFNELSRDGRHRYRLPGEARRWSAHFGHFSAAAMTRPRIPFPALKDDTNFPGTATGVPVLGLRTVRGGR